MPSELWALAMTAVSIGFIHTCAGPDHYLPFVALAKARKWTGNKTLLLTFVCGAGHVFASAVLGAVGVLLGFGVAKLQKIETYWGNIGAWGLIAFGLLYFAWGIKRAGKMEHEHVFKLSPWVLFIIFVLGPCEPLIPLLIYGAAKFGFYGASLTFLLFACTTVLTMLAAVLAALRGVTLLPTFHLERYSHALAGAVIFVSGLVIQVGF
ncbi:MAG: hypothetical protein HY537_02495 [Deltaproteobacteria bacterium]|nr:hypothetical protein [Deltaproteobacteria bacterium]